MFADQERHAFDLGRRMSKANFSFQDNPFTHIHPRLAVQWQHGFLAAQTIHALSTTLARGVDNTATTSPRQRGLSHVRPHVQALAAEGRYGPGARPANVAESA
jgi:hypothetical protein